MIIVMSYVTDVPVASSTASVAGPSNPKSTRVLRKKGTTHKLVFLYFSFYPKEEEGWCVSSSVICGEEPPSCRQKEGNIVYGQSIRQRCVFLVWRRRFPVMMDGVWDGSISERFFFSALLINIYVKIQKMFYFSFVEIMFHIWNLCIISLPIMTINIDFVRLKLQFLPASSFVFNRKK